MTVSRPKTQFIDLTFGQGNYQGREPFKIIGEEPQRGHHFKHIGSSAEEGRHDNINYTHSECSMEKMVEMQKNVVRHEDKSETEGIQNNDSSAAMWRG